MRRKRNTYQPAQSVVEFSLFVFMMAVILIMIMGSLNRSMQSIIIASADEMGDEVSFDDPPMLPTTPPGLPTVTWMPLPSPTDVPPATATKTPPPANTATSIPTATRTNTSVPTATRTNTSVPTATRTATPDPAKPVPTSPDDCKNNNWKHHYKANGDPFANRQECLAYVESQ